MPVLDFLAQIPAKARVKVIARFERLSQLGHEMRRPECDYVGDGIYELRTRLGHVNYRVLYFFHRSSIAILACGLTKEDTLPVAELERAKTRKKRFERNPASHMQR